MSEPAAPSSSSVSIAQPSILVIGASQAGLQVASSLRDAGHDGPVHLVGAETYLPYQRPPLSKEFLLGNATRESLSLRSAQWFQDQQIELTLGHRVVRLAMSDRGAGGVATLDDGQTIAFTKLALTVGGRPRRLTVPGHDLPGVHYFRNLDDAERLRGELRSARRLVVIGGGFIGLEAAAVARSRGMEVTVVEAGARVLARGLSKPVSDFIAQHHRDHGVRLFVDSEVVAFDGPDGTVSGVHLSDSQRLPADVVLVGVGLEPRIGLAKQAGLRCAGGIVIDPAGQTSHPDVVAAGDCAVISDPSRGTQMVRLESMQGAVQQGRAAAHTLVGRDAPAFLAPWFWSHQYDLQVQICGLTADHDQAVLRSGDRPGSFSYLLYRDGVLIGSESINCPSDFAAVRRALDSGINLLPDEVANSGTPLKTLLLDRAC